jgi:hypothetical protein
VDHLQVVVDRTPASGTNSLGTAGYDAATNSIYTSTFGAGMAIRRITDIDGADLSQVLVNENQMTIYIRDGDPNRGVISPIMSGLVLNPKPVGDFAANSFAIITDIGSTRFPGTNTTDPEATKRLYRYNLGALPQEPGAPGDGRDVFTTLVRLADMNAAKGAPASNTSSNSGRQGAFSSDGRHYYFIDQSDQVGGVYKTDVLSGGATLLLSAADINTDAAVLPLAGGGDRVLFKGAADIGNVGGISYIDHVNGTTGTPQTFVPAAELANFLEQPVGDADVRSVTTDGAGNVYFFDVDADVMVRRDPQGRMSKVVTNVERTAFRDQIGKTGTVNGNVLKLQTRTATHPTAGKLTQILYPEPTAQNYVAGVWAFEAGDFNRDGDRSAADIALFKPVLTTRGVPLSGSGNYKFDMNGNAVVDWKDVKILQQFFDFGDGDIDINGLVDFADFLTLRDNFGTGGKRFTEGDLDGNNAVDFLDFQVLERSFGYRSSVLGGVTLAAFDGAAWDAFAASVPEPDSIGVLGLFAIGLARRRGRRTVVG